MLPQIIYTTKLFKIYPIFYQITIKLPEYFESKYIEKMSIFAYYSFDTSLCPDRFSEFLFSMPQKADANGLCHSASLRSASS